MQKISSVSAEDLLYIIYSIFFIFKTNEIPSTISIIEYKNNIAPSVAIIISGTKIIYIPHIIISIAIIKVTIHDFDSKAFNFKAKPNLIKLL